MAKKTGAGKQSRKTKRQRGGASTEPERITSEQAMDFIRQMQKAFPKPPRTKAEKAALQEYLAKFRDEELKAVGTRVQKDLMVHPPRTIEPNEYEKDPRAHGRRRKATRKRT